MKKSMKAAADRDPPVSKKPKRQQLYWIYKTVMNRRNFKYSLGQTFKYFCCRFCCRICRSRSFKDENGKERFRSSDHRLDYLFEKG